jgi:hypothetical protein
MEVFDIIAGRELSWRDLRDFLVRRNLVTKSEQAFPRYWLAGSLFFGSSVIGRLAGPVLERIRRLFGVRNKRTTKMQKQLLGVSN